MANAARKQPNSIPQQNETAADDNDVNPLENVQTFYETNKRNITTAITVVVLVVGGILGYIFMYQAPNNKKAAETIAMPQVLFQMDSMNLALSGFDKNIGFPKIEKKYSGTDAGNLAHFYAGIAYLKTGDYKNAIKSLKEFDGKGTIVGNLATGSLGIAYMESGDKTHAIEYLKKATEGNTDNLTTPMFLYPLALIYEQDGKVEEAKKLFIKIRDEYPRSMQGRDMDKELARLGVLE